ncbi:hypothetical protein BP6252_14143 [Coleophoma cylindrospora]|uniref:Aspartate aminotransferase n=1 Tax=Coleophoma cylindrospora TaxID=1849047 RepID=A0A3D8Q452_9HELO|nr:hypothetical protein BP6252_14143 [Coleophoma cylindrospora]
MIKCLQAESSPGDVIILHAAAHNPTGLDPTKDQWKGVADLCVQLQLFPLFDSAYQGFASGNLLEDGWAMKHFLGREGLEMGIAQSFSKNFGLYGERVGALHIKSNSTEIGHDIGNLLERLARSEITCPPLYGARIVAQVLNDPKLFAEWERDLVTMSVRIARMRREFYQRLVELETPGHWEHIISQIGMFSYMGLTREQVIVLREEFHIYLLDTGRVAITGLTMENVDYVAQSIDTVVRRVTNVNNSA